MNRKLGRKKDHRQLLIRNLVTSLILFERVETTEAKAKEAKSFLDQLLARNNKTGLTSYRRLSEILLDSNAVHKVIDELMPRYQNRQSGFVKSYHLKNRLGDNAPMMRLELVDSKVFVDRPISKANQEESIKDIAKEDKKAEVKIKTGTAK